MKTLRRIIFVILSVLLVFSLTACGKKTIDPFDSSIFDVKDGEGVIINYELDDYGGISDIFIENTLPSSDVRSRISYYADVRDDLCVGEEIVVTAYAPFEVTEKYELKEESITVQVPIIEGARAKVTEEIIEEYVIPEVKEILLQDANTKRGIISADEYWYPASDSTTSASIAERHNGELSDYEMLLHQRIEEYLTEMGDKYDYITNMGAYKMRILRDDLVSSPVYRWTLCVYGETQDILDYSDVSIQYDDSRVIATLSVKNDYEELLNNYINDTYNYSKYYELFFNNFIYDKSGGIVIGSKPEWGQSIEPIYFASDYMDPSFEDICLLSDLYYMTDSNDSGWDEYGTISVD